MHIIFRKVLTRKKLPEPEIDTEIDIVSLFNIYFLVYIVDFFSINYTHFPGKYIELKTRCYAKCSKKSSCRIIAIVIACFPAAL